MLDHYKFGNDISGCIKEGKPVTSSIVTLYSRNNHTYWGSL